MNEGIKKGDVINIIVPSTEGDIAVTAYVVETIKVEVDSDTLVINYIMYSLNRLFRLSNIWARGYDYDEEGCPKEEITVTSLCYEGVIADYVVIPEAEEKLVNR